MRCRENQVCRIVRSAAGNEGRLVFTTGPYDVIRNGITHHNAGTSLAAGGPAWFVKPLQPLRCKSALLAETVYSMDRCVFPDDWLEPVLPESETVEVETEAHAFG